MLTRDGERVLEVLLLAAGIAVAVIIKGDLPLLDSTRAAGSAGHSITAMTPVPVGWERPAREDWLVPDAKAPAEMVERMLTDAAARLAELEGRISRC